jgi:hypothetical protein
MAESSGLRVGDREAGGRKGQAVHRKADGGPVVVIGDLRAALRPRVETSAKSQAVARQRVRRMNQWMIFRRSCWR